MDIRDLKTVSHMIISSKKWFGEDWLWGSPYTGAIKYHVPLWDLSLTREYVRIPKGKIEMFGRKFYHGLTYVRWEFETDLVVVSYKELVHWNTRTGWQSFADDQILEDVNYVGDIQSFENAITWFKLMSTIDIPQS